MNTTMPVSGRKVNTVIVLPFIYSHYGNVNLLTLLKKGFNNSPEYLKAVALDNSHFTEPLLSEESYNLIEKYTTQDNDLMTKDSLESFGRRAEGGEGKQVFYFALEKYNSKWLDSIAKVQAKMYLKNGPER
ncbi:MAG: hypothetical protein EOO01_11850 [Chitinophagaceae bacterium]|nr:MAG: hypothetical protein EOO01_11850 [Chitinophagaceae bacterium]